MPAVPLAQPHHIVVDFLVQLVEQSDGLHDHEVDLVGGELEFLAGQVVGQTQGHTLDLSLGQT